jgi:hypothetical protein
MTRRGPIVGLALAGLSLSSFLGPSEVFSQSPADASAETQAAIAQYCTGCHNERLKTADLRTCSTGA